MSNLLDSIIKLALNLSRVLSERYELGEVFKKLVQDPANHKIDGGLCLHPLSQPQTMVSSLFSSKE